MAAGQAEPQQGMLRKKAKFWDGVADGYATKAVPSEEVYAKKLEKTREYLTPESRVLEFGCGTGTTAVKLAPFVKHYQATDLSPKMVEHCERRKAEAGVTNVDFSVGTLDDEVADEPHFDVVIGMSILHLMPDDERARAIAKAHRILKPGGVFVQSTVCIGEKAISGLLRAVLPAARFFGLAPYVAVLTTDQIVREFAEEGRFTVDFQWRPEGSDARFLVMRKTEGGTSPSSQQ